MALINKPYPVGKIRDMKELFARIEKRLLAENIESEILDDGLSSFWIRYTCKDKIKKPRKAEEIVSKICDEELRVT